MFYEAMWGMHALWWVFWIALVIVVLAWIRGGPWGSGDRSVRETPHEILRRRLASGEINIEEFESRKAALDQGGASRQNPP